MIRNVCTIEHMLIVKGCNMKELILKRHLVFLWNKIIDIKIDICNRVLIINDILVSTFFTAPKIKSIDATLKEIINNKSSVSRYGDGEFKLINNQNITFQQSEPMLSRRLKEILLNQDDNFLVCLPDVFQDLDQYAVESKEYWRLHTAKYRLKWYKVLNKEKVYYNSFISRFYYPFTDKSNCDKWLSMLRTIWTERDIVIIEGKKSRLGIGNDLFNQVKSIERILVPEENAFLQYEKILMEAKKVNKSKLILLAIGPTATVLAYDLYKVGFQAIDIGHVDIEYEWFLRKVKMKTEIENKYVCEAGAGEGVGDIQDEKYLKEIKVVVS